MIKFLNIKQHKAEVKRLKFVMKFQDQLDSLVKTVKDRARNEIFDNSYYREINVPIQNKDKSVFALVKEDFIRLSALEDKYEFYKSKGVRLFIKEVKADYNERLSTVVVELTLIAVIKEQKEVIEMVSAMTQNRLYDSFILDFFEEELNKGLAELEKKEK